MKTFRICIQIALLLTASSAYAQTEMPLSAKIDKILHTYADAVGCDFGIDRKNIVEMDIEGNGEKEFIALFRNDDGCSGGSGSVISNLAVLEQHDEEPDKGSIYVRPEMTMPVAAGIGLPRFIDRIFVKEGQLWFAGRIHADKDGSNFPTIPVQAQIQLLKSEDPVDVKNKRTIYVWKSTKDFQGK